MAKKQINATTVTMKTVEGILGVNSPSEYTAYIRMSAAFAGLGFLRNQIELKREGQILYNGIWGSIFQILSAGSANQLTFITTLRSLVFHIEVAALIRNKYRLADRRKEDDVNGLTNANIQALLSQTQNSELAALTPLAGSATAIHLELIKQLVTGTIAGKETLDFRMNRPILGNIATPLTLETTMMALRAISVNNLINLGPQVYGVDTLAEINVIIQNVVQVRQYDLIIQMYNHPSWLFAVLNDENNTLTGPAGHDMRRDQLYRTAALLKSVLTFGNMFNFFFTQYAYNQSKEFFNVIPDPGMDKISGLEAEIESFDYLNCKADFLKIIDFIADTAASDNPLNATIKPIFPGLSLLLPQLPALPPLPVLPVTPPVFSNTSLDTVFFGQAMLALTSNLPIAPFNKYQNPGFVFGLETAYYNILRGFLAGLQLQLYNLEQKTFLGQITEKLDVSKSPICARRFMFFDAASHMIQKTDGTSITYNNLDGSSIIDTQIAEDGVVTNPVHLDTDWLVDYYPLFGYDISQYDNYINLFGIPSGTTYAVPGCFSDRNEFYEISDVVSIHQNATIKTLQHISSDMLNICTSALGLTYEQGRQAFVNDAVRRRLATCLAGVAMTTRITTLQVQAMGIDWQTGPVANNAALLTFFNNNLSGGSFINLAIDAFHGLVYGLNSAQLAQHLAYQYTQVLGAGQTRLPVSIIRLADDSAMIVMFYEFVPQIPTGLATTRIMVGNDYINLLTGQDLASGITSAGYAIFAALNVFTFDKDPVCTGVHSNVFAEQYNPLAVPLYTDYAIYQPIRVVTLERKSPIFINNNKRSITVELSLAPGDYPGVLPPGARFITYSRPVKSFTPGISSDVTENAINARLAKISEEISKTARIADTSVEKVSTPLEVTGVADPLTDIPEAQKLLNLNGVNEQPERDTDELVAKNSNAAKGKLVKK